MPTTKASDRERRSPVQNCAVPDRRDFIARNGFPELPVPADAGRVTPEHVAELLDRVDSD